MSATTNPPPWMRRAAHALLLWTAAMIPLSISGMEIGIGGLTALAIAAVALGWMPRPRTTLDGPMVVFFGVLLLSTLASGKPWEAVGWARPWVALGFIGIAWWLDDDTIAWRFVRLLVVAGAFACAYGIVQHYTGTDAYRALVGRPRVVRPRDAAQVGFAVVGFFRNYLTFAHAMLIPFAFALAMAVRRRGLGLLAAPAMLVAIIFSTARGAWIGAITVVAVVTLLAADRRAWAAALVAGVLAIVAVGFSPYLRGHAGTIVGTGGENAHRLAIYQANLDIIDDHPWLGLGFGRYLRAADHYYDAHPLANRRSHAHSNPLQIAAEAGLIGLAAFALLFARAIQMAGRRARQATTPDGWVIAAGAAAGLVGFLVGGVTQYNFGDNEVAVAMWATMALAAGRVR